MKTSLKTKIKPSIGCLVEVTWPDTQTNPDWSRISEIPCITPPIVKTVGRYMGCRRKGKKVLWIIVAHSINQSNGIFDYTVIPYGPEVAVERIEC